MALYLVSFFIVVDCTLMNMLQPAHDSVQYRRIVIAAKYGKFYVIWFRTLSHDFLFSVHVPVQTSCIFVCRTPGNKTIQLDYC
jgi:hypothetical protein